jgi:hypothetical protein
MPFEMCQRTVRKTSYSGHRPRVCLIVSDKSQILLIDKPVGKLGPEHFRFTEAL